MPPNVEQVNFLGSLASSRYQQVLTENNRLIGTYRAATSLTTDLIGRRGSTEDIGYGIALDSNVTGYTDSANFSITADAYQTTFGGGEDALYSHDEKTLEKLLENEKSHL